MADFNITVSNQLNCLGGSPTTNWGKIVSTMVWGTSKWGEGTEKMIVFFERLISNSLSSDTTVGNSVQKLVSNDLTFTVETVDETIQQGIWYLVFKKPTTDFDMQYIPVYTSGVSDTETYSSLTATSTSWSLE